MKRLLTCKKTKGMQNKLQLTAIIEVKSSLFNKESTNEFNERLKKRFYHLSVHFMHMIVLFYNKELVIMLKAITPHQYGFNSLT